MNGLQEKKCVWDKESGNLDKLSGTTRRFEEAVVVVDELLIVGWWTGDRRSLVCFGFCSSARFPSPPVCLPLPSNLGQARSESR